jgi:hypothetical protein
MATFVGADVHDPRVNDEFLREETRKQRRNLDIVAVLAGLVVILNLVPNRISAVGIDFGETRKQTFLILLLVFDLWFSLVFAIYAAGDLRGNSVRSRRFGYAHPAET